MRAHSLTDNLWWLLPPAAALFYPQAVRALYESGKLLQRTSGLGAAVAWLSIVVTVAFVYGVPAVGISVAYVLGRHDSTTPSELLARRLAHLAVASPSLFVFIGVVFFLLHSNGERIAHGTSALLIVLIFVAWHLLNPASAAFNSEFNQATVLTLRKWYRSEFVQPLLVTLMLFQVIRGAILWWRAAAGPEDL